MTNRAKAGFVASAVLLALSLPLAPSSFANHDNKLLDTEPELAAEDVGEEHTLIGTLCVKDTGGGPPATCDAATLANDAAPVQIDFELESGPNDEDGDSELAPDATCNVVGGDSSCEVTYTGDGGPGTDVWRTWIDHDGSNTTSEADPDEPRDESQDTALVNGTDCTGAASVVEGPPGGEPDCTDVVQVTWSKQGGTPSTVDCDDETGPDRERQLNPSLSGPQSSEAYTCTVRDEEGDLIGDNDPNTGGDQDIVVSGENESTVNDPDIAEGASHAEPDYSCTAGNSDDQGDPPIGQCTISVNQSEGEEGTASICFWIGADPATKCAIEPTDENASTDTGTNTQGNDGADRVEKTWEARSAAEGDGGVDAEPETATNDVGEEHTIAVTVYDQFGEPFQGNTVATLEFFEGSPSDDDGNTPASPDESCTTLNSSSCVISYTSTEEGRDLACVWTNTAPAMSGNNQDGTCAGEGLNDADDSAGSADPPSPATDDVDVVSKTWLNPEPASTLDCGPESDSSTLGETHVIECTASNQNGPVDNAEVDVEFTGANDDDGNSRDTPDDSCRTDDEGICELEHPTNPETGETGKTTYRAWLDDDYFDATAESDNTEGTDETASGSAGSEAEPDGTDVMETTWLPVADRTISIGKNKKRVDRGDFVKISGAIDAVSTDCQVAQSVRLKARRIGGKFKKIATQITDGGGDYVFRLQVFRTKEYRTVAPATDECDFAKSRIIKVRRA